MDNFKIDFEIFKQLSHSLLNNLKGNEKSYKGILCPLRGGFYLSYFMSKHLNLPILYIEISSYTNKEQREFQIGLKPELAKGKFLLCDDIYDSGNTIKKIHSMYPHVTFDTICLVSKLEAENIKYGLKVNQNQWVDFFWETM